MVVLIIAIVFLIICILCRASTKKDLRNQKEFLQNLPEPEWKEEYADNQYWMAGMYYQGINYDVNCEVYAQKEYNEHDKTAIGIYTKDGDIKLGYIAKDWKDRTLFNAIKKHDNHLEGIVEIGPDKDGYTHGQFFFLK